MKTKTLMTGLIPVLAVLLAGCQSGDEYPVVGTLERDRITLTAELREPVTAIEVREGQKVAAGEVLVRLDERRAEADLAQNQARVEQAGRRLDELLRGPRQEAIDEARARLVAAESALKTAEQDLARVRRMTERDLASERDLDAAVNAREQAEGEHDGARAALAAMLEGTTVEELDQARAGVAEAEAAARGAQFTLERLALESPRDAIVEALPFELGETPQPGQAVAILRATDQPPYARVYVPAALRAQFAPGEKVRVHVDHYGEYTGTVRYVAGEAAFTPFFALTEHDAGRLSYLAEIDLAGADDLPAGIPVRAVVPGGDS